MENEYIEVRILPNGEVRYEAVGFKGPACEKATQFIRDALGGNVTEERTGEYYETATEKAKAEL